MVVDDKASKEKFALPAETPNTRCCTFTASSNLKSSEAKVVGPGLISVSMYCVPVWRIASTGVSKG